MVWRIIMRYLGNHEQLIERLSQTMPIKRAAQMTAYFILKWRSVGQESLNDALKSQNARNLEEQSKEIGEKLRSFISKFSQEVKDGMKSIEEKKKNR